MLPLLNHVHFESKFQHLRYVRNPLHTSDPSMQRAADLVCKQFKSRKDHMLIYVCHFLAQMHLLKKTCKQTINSHLMLHINLLKAGGSIDEQRPTVIHIQSEY